MYLQGKGRGREEPNFGFHGTPAPPDPRPTGLGVRDLAAGPVSPGQQSSRAAPARRGAWVAAPSAAPGRVPQPAGRPPSSRLSQALSFWEGARDAVLSRRWRTERTKGIQLRAPPAGEVQAAPPLGRGLAKQFKTRSRRVAVATHDRC